MKNRKIVRRIYTKDNGEECNKVMYASSPVDVCGGEYFNTDIEKAHLFKDDDIMLTFKECEIKGNDRSGDFSYKQEIVVVKLTIKK